MQGIFILSRRRLNEKKISKQKIDHDRGMWADSRSAVVHDVDHGRRSATAGLPSGFRIDGNCRWSPDLSQSGRTTLRKCSEGKVSCRAWLQGKSLHH